MEREQRISDGFTHIKNERKLIPLQPIFNTFSQKKEQLNYYMSVINTTFYLYTMVYTEWPKKMCKLFTHQYLWNKFK